MSTKESAASQAEGSASAQACLAYLAKHGLLMKADARLPSVTTMVTGEPVKASWWAHPLLDRVNALGSIERKGQAARLLESRLLVHGIQVHSHEGHHRKRLETWQQWAARAGQSLGDLPPASEAKLSLTQIWPNAKWPWSKR